MVGQDVGGRSGHNNPRGEETDYLLQADFSPEYGMETALVILVGEALTGGVCSHRMVISYDVSMDHVHSMSENTSAGGTAVGVVVNFNPAVKFYRSTVWATVSSALLMSLQSS